MWKRPLLDSLPYGPIDGPTRGGDLVHRIMFLGKRDDPRCRLALEFVELVADDVQVHLGAWGDPLPPAAEEWRGDYIISFLSRWIVPAAVLERASRAAINFHPAPPEYPGVGCTNFALYDEVESYGVTCHHMSEVVDTGALVAVRRFPVFASDDVASLLERTYAHLLVLYYEIVGDLARGSALPQSDASWTRPPYTRAELDELATITPDMDIAERRRRVRATTYGDWKPTVRADA